jgi:putative hydrolase of the HAD superfamily
LKLIGFDLDGTLYNQWDYEKLLFLEISKLIESEFGFVQKTIFSEMKKLFDEKKFTRLFDFACVNSGFSLPSNWNDFVNKEILPFYRHFKPTVAINLYDWVLPILTKLRAQGSRLVLITNGGATIQQNKIDLLGISDIFDKVYISDAFHPPLRKPDLTMFKMALDDFQILPNSMVYIGDSPAIDSACEKLGIHFVLYRGNHQELLNHFEITIS